MEDQNKIIDRTNEEIDNLRYNIIQQKDKAMDADLDELASELNSIQNNLEVFSRRLLHLKEKYIS